MAAGVSAPLYTREILRLAATIPGVVRFEELADVPDTRVVRASRLYRTPAWGVTAQPDFINAVALLDFWSEICFFHCLCWTGAREMFVHRMCVKLRRCRGFGTSSSSSCSSTRC